MTGAVAVVVVMVVVWWTKIWCHRIGYGKNREWCRAGNEVAVCTGIKVGVVPTKVLASQGPQRCG